MSESSQSSPVREPALSGAERLRRRQGHKARGKPRSVVLVTAIVLIFALGLWISGRWVDFFRFLYSPWLVMVVIIAVIEYIVLKGRDRSRMYRLELDRLRERKAQELVALRGIEEELHNLESSLGKIRDESPECADALQRIAKLRGDLARKF